MPEGCRKARPWQLNLLHLGNRRSGSGLVASDQRQGQLIRASRGVYLRPITSRFGTRAPSVQQAVRRSPANAARSSSRAGRRRPTRGLRHRCRSDRSYLTSGRSRTMNLGKQVVELRHAPRWQLALAHKPAGGQCALAWLGPERRKAALKTLSGSSAIHFQRTGRGSARLPTWLARSVEGGPWLTPFSTFRSPTAARR